MKEDINPNKRKILEYVNAESLANCFTFKSEATKAKWQDALKTELKPTEIEDGKIKVQMCTGCIILGSLFFSVVNQLIEDKKINPDNITNKDISTMVGVMDSISKNLEEETGNRIPNLWKCGGMAVTGSYCLYGNIIYAHDKSEESSESIMDIYIRRGREAFLKRKENGYSSSPADKYKNKYEETQPVEDSAIYRRLIESWKKRNFGATKDSTEQER